MSLTVEQVLKQSGFTDEQIAALDSKVTGAFGTVLSTAVAEREAAELASRAQYEDYDKRIAPALDDWASKSATKDAEVAYYKTLVEKAKEGGFIASETPITQNSGASVRGPGGQFVAGANAVPGSPQYMTRQDGYAAITNSTWAVTEYMRLNNGAPPPDDIETLNSESVAQRMPFRDYVSKKYGFEQKRSEIKASEQKKIIDAAVNEAVTAERKKFAEAGGNNPNVRRAEVSRFSEINRAVKEGKRSDPIGMTPQQRHANTRQAIAAEVQETVQ